MLAPLCYDLLTYKKFRLVGLLSDERIGSTKVGSGQFAGVNCVGHVTRTFTRLELRDELHRLDRDEP